MITWTKIMKFLIGLVLFVSFNSFGETITLTFDSLSDYVVGNNNDYKGSLQERDSQKALTGYLKRSFLPALKVSAGTANTAESLNKKTQNYNFLEADIDLNIFKGGRDRLEENARLSSLRVSNVRSEQVKYDNLTRARELYWDLVYQKEVTRILNAAISLIFDNQKAAQKRISGGIATSTDRIDFEQSELQYKQDLQKSEILYENIERELVALLNLPLGTVLNTEVLIPHSHDHSKNEFANTEFNSEFHRDFQFYSETSQLFNFEKTKLSRWWTPDLDLYAGMTRRTNDLNHENAFTVVQENGFIGGIRLTFEFDGFNNKSISTSKYYQAMANDYYKKQRKLELDARYSNAMKLFTLNHNLVHSSEENIKKSEYYLKNTRDEYLRGIKNSPDVLQASQRLITAQVRYAEIKKDYQLAKVEILGLVGK